MAAGGISGSPRGLRVGVVLGAGGVLGAAWMIGALVAVQERLGFGLAETELVVGTSAGSVVAAALRCGVTVDDMVAHQRGGLVGGVIDLGPPDLGGRALPPPPLLRVGSPRLMLTALRAPHRVNPWVAASALLPQGRARHVALHAMVHAMVSHAWPHLPPPHGGPHLDPLGGKRPGPAGVQNVLNVLNAANVNAAGALGIPGSVTVPAAAGLGAVGDPGAAGGPGAGGGPSAAGAGAAVAGAQSAGAVAGGTGIAAGVAGAGGVEDEWARDGRTWIVAVDYDTGRRVVFGRAGAPAVGLPDAVVASCSIPVWYQPAVIGGRRYVDGGLRSATSAGLLAEAGLDEVYVLAPMASLVADRPWLPHERLERRLRRRITAGLLRDVELLRSVGTAVTVLTPGPEDLAAIGANLMDPRRRLDVLETSLRTTADALAATGGTLPPSGHTHAA